jgi:predicted GNAT family acetyltransferase
MMSIRAYKTPQQFLDDTEEILEQKEVENNLILGICNGFADKSKAYEGCVFINSFEDRKIQATSIKTISKAVVSGTTKDVQYIKGLADYYLDNNIELTGAVSESFYSTEFSDFYGKRQIGKIILIVHKLTSVNGLPLTTGRFETANADDIDLIAEWTIGFEKDAKAFPIKTKEQALKTTQERIALGNLFKWVDKGEIVSIAAIVRKTRHLGIVGLVYTPDESRGKGYATSCVQKLSEHILQNGFKYCALFTDKSNPTSNHIYKKIGYFPITEFTDIEYE